MIEGFLSDLRKMSITGMILFFFGFIVNLVFIIFLGASLVSIGFSLFSILSKEYEGMKKKLI